MDSQQEYWDMLTSFTQDLNITSRRTGLLDIINMKWNAAGCQLSYQFKHLYNSRMDKLQRRLEAPGLIPICQVMDNNRKYSISGIIKRLEFNRVRAFQKEFNEVYNSDKPLYNQNDELEIQDKTGKLKLVLRKDCTLNNQRQIKISDLPYGVNVTLEGKFAKLQNKFYVKNILQPDIAPQKPLKSNNPACQVLILSQPSPDQLIQVYQMLNTPYGATVHSINALIIVGGLEMKPDRINKMAQMLVKFQKTIDVFVMPSSGLERQRIYPLTAYNGLYFPQTHRNIGLCSNPQLFEAKSGVNMHVSCGQNVRDFLKNGCIAVTELQALEQMVYFSHFCPTAPFSLKSQPYLQDYLVIQQLPHIMVSGKAKSHQSKLLQIQQKSVLLIALPEKGKVLVDLANLSSIPLI